MRKLALIVSMMGLWAHANLDGVYFGTGQAFLPDGKQIPCNVGFGLMETKDELTMKGAIYECSGHIFSYEKPFHWKIIDADLWLADRKIGAITNDGFNAKFQMDELQFSINLLETAKDTYAFKHLESGTAESPLLSSTVNREPWDLR